MASSQEQTLTGTHGPVVYRHWPADRPRYAAVLAHGYGEHIGRYEHVAAALLAHGATVYGPDHIGHGRSSGERALIDDFEDVVTDLRSVAEQVPADLPTVLIGHSMGGMIATWYAQRYGSSLTALVLSGPVLGQWEVIDALRALDEIPYIPIDPATLSRDPEVGRAYENDPLVWHGSFHRETLDAFAACLDTINHGGRLGTLPTLWAHGEEDTLVPLAQSRTGIDAVGGDDLTTRRYPGARHEIFNETNQTEVLSDVTAFIGEKTPG